MNGIKINNSKPHKKLFPFCFNNFKLLNFNISIVNSSKWFSAVFSTIKRT